MLAQVNQKAWALTARQAELRGLSPESQVRSAQQRLDDLSARAAAGLHYRLSLERQRWRGLDQALNNVSPLAVLNRGYALVSLPDGTLVRQTKQVQPGQPLRVRVTDGEFNVIGN